MPTASRSIEWWRERCIEWCHDDRRRRSLCRPGLSRFVSAAVFAGESHREHRRKPRALEYRQLPDRFSRQPGADRCRSSAGLFSFSGPEKGLALVHFQQPPRLSRAVFRRDVRNHIYKPYVDELLAIEKTVDPILQVCRGDAAPPVDGRRCRAISQKQGAECRGPRYSSCWTSSPGGHFSCFAAGRISYGPGNSR